MKTEYLFTSENLGFRNWRSSDLFKMSAINSDPIVMEYFPSIQDSKKTKDFIARMQKQFSEKGFCYFAVDKLENKKFIGFIGLSEQTFISEFTPCIDIGWRLCRSEWAKGYATEGAKRCLDYASQDIGLNKILAICPELNIASEKVMLKIGMQKVKSFKHALLKDHKDLETCVLYEVQF